MLNKIISILIVGFIFFMPLFAQDDFSDDASETLSITGLVTDASTGKPIAGSNVIVDDSDAGAAADEDGKFSIEGVSAGSSITASAIGYEDLTLYADQSELNFASKLPFVTNPFYSLELKA